MQGRSTTSIPSDLCTDPVGLAHYNDSPSPETHRSKHLASSLAGPSVSFSTTNKESNRSHYASFALTTSLQSILWRNIYPLDGFIHSDNALTTQVSFERLSCLYKADLPEVQASPAKRPRTTSPVRHPPLTSNIDLSTEAPGTARRKGKGRSRQDAIEIDEDNESSKIVVAQSFPSDVYHSTDDMEGMTQEEMFAIVSKPDPIPGLDNWGIPPPVNPDLCSAQLKVRIKPLTAFTTLHPLSSFPRLYNASRLCDRPGPPYPLRPPPLPFVHHLYPSYLSCSTLRY